MKWTDFLVSLPEISRLSGNRDWIDVEFVEHERTPESAMGLGIQSHVTGLSLANTVELLDSLGVQRSRKAVHDLVQKADRQPESGRSPNQFALDETVIRINDQQFWLYAVTRNLRFLVGERDSVSSTLLIQRRTNCFMFASFRRRPLSP